MSREKKTQGEFDCGEHVDFQWQKVVLGNEKKPQQDVRSGYVRRTQLHEKND